MTTGIRRDQWRGLEQRPITGDDIVDGSIVPADFDASVYGGAPSAIDPDDAGAAGVAATVSRSDHQHQFTTAAPGSIAPDDTATEGVAATMARSDHRHAITAAAAAALTRTNTPGEGAAADFARSDHVHSLGVLPWGVVARQVLNTPSSTFTADATTDMVLNNVSVIAGHLYLAVIQGLGNFSAASGQWQLNLHVNTVYVDTFTRLVNEAAAATRHSIGGMCFWEAPTTQATDDFTVVADERTGTADLTLVGGTDATDPPRSFHLIDLGDAP